MSRITHTGSVPNWPRRIEDRLRHVERDIWVANTTVSPADVDVLDGNMIHNSGFETGGLAGWHAGQFVTRPAVRIMVTSAHPSAGTYACEVSCDSPAVIQYMRPDIIVAVQPTERWRLRAHMRSTLASSTGKLVLATSTVVSNNEQPDGGGIVTWVTAASGVAVDGPSGAYLVGDAIVPSGRFFVGAYFGVIPDPSDTSGDSYTWWLDECSMRRVLHDASPAGP